MTTKTVKANSKYAVLSEVLKEHAEFMKRIESKQNGKSEAKDGIK